MTLQHGVFSCYCFAAHKIYFTDALGVQRPFLLTTRGCVARRKCHSSQKVDVHPKVMTYQPRLSAHHNGVHWSITRWSSSSQHKLHVQTDTCLTSVALECSLSKKGFYHALPPIHKMRWLKDTGRLLSAKFEMYNHWSLEIVLMPQSN